MYQQKEGGEPAVPVWGGEELIDMLGSTNGNGLGTFFDNGNGTNGNSSNNADAYAGSDNHYYESDLPA